MATWFQGTADEFIRVSREGFERGVQHPALPRRQLDRRRRRPRDRADQDDDLAARRRSRASSATSSAPGASTTSSSAATAAGASCCASRSTRRTASTRSIRRRGSRSTRRCSARFPEGYRHLAYLQTQIGYPVKDDMPGLTGPEVEALYARGAGWLAGAAPGRAGVEARRRSSAAAARWSRRSTVSRGRGGELEARPRASRSVVGAQPQHVPAANSSSPGRDRRRRR